MSVAAKEEHESPQKCVDQIRMLRCCRRRHVATRIQNSSFKMPAEGAMMRRGPKLFAAEEYPMIRHPWAIDGLDVMMDTYEKCPHRTSRNRICARRCLGKLYGRRVDVPSGVPSPFLHLASRGAGHSCNSCHDSPVYFPRLFAVRIVRCSFIATLN